MGIGFGNGRDRIRIQDAGLHEGNHAFMETERSVEIHLVGNADATFQQTIGEISLEGQVVDRVESQGLGDAMEIDGFA